MEQNSMLLFVLVWFMNQSLRIFNFSPLHTVLVIIATPPHQIDHPCTGPSSATYMDMN